MAKMSGKQKSAVKKAVRKELKALRKELKDAFAIQAVIDELQVQVENIEEKLQKAEDRIGALEGERDVKVSPAREDLETPSTVPNEDWTVAQLRAEARKREIPGYSNKNKAALLDELVQARPADS